MWIARDKNGDLCVYGSKPERFDDEVYGDYGKYQKLPEEWFPEVTWENSPKELIIKEDNLKEELQISSDCLFNKDGWMDIGDGLKMDRNGNIAGGLKL